MPASLEKRHLADLHALAAELEIERFRLLARDELIAAIQERDPDAAAREPESATAEEQPVRDGARASSRRAERGRGRGRGRERRDPEPRASGRDRGERDPDEDASEEDEAGEPIAGVLDITPRGHGFIRLNGLEASEGDVYVSPSQIRRCELERGDEVGGPARQPRRGERYPALIHVDSINGAEPGTSRIRLAETTPEHPSRRIELTPAAGASDQERILLRSVDLLTPLARGQRVLVTAAPGSGRTTLLRAIAGSVGVAEDLELVVLLIDERPEEVAAWREAAPDGEFAIATSEMRSGEQLRLVELAVGRASRRAEAGADVVLLIDSISRVAVAADDPGRVKPIFGAGRESAEEEVGSLTVIATTLSDGEDEGGVERALGTTESALIPLDRELAAAGVVPAIDATTVRVAGEERLRDEPELSAVRALRVELAKLGKAEAADDLRARIEGTQDNRALLGTLDG